MTKDAVQLMVDDRRSRNDWTVMCVVLISRVLYFEKRQELLRNVDFVLASMCFY